jgi:uncharacterized damage-inducible protein DinB
MMRSSVNDTNGPLVSRTVNEFISDIGHEFRRHKGLADRAISAQDDEAFFRQPAKQVNSVAIVVKHLAGNLLSRWTNFLTTDGDKPGRNRDGEFVIEPRDSRPQLLAQWEAGWNALLGTVDSLKDDDLDNTVTIRGEPHTVRQALLRSMTHVAYHVGQITYLARLYKPDAPWLTIAPGQSRAHKANYRGT